MVSKRVRIIKTKVGMGLKKRWTMFQKEVEWFYKRV
jgi:hypothetical protein